VSRKSSIRWLNHLKTQFLLNSTYKSSPYVTGNKLRPHYKAQPVNAVWGNSGCLFWEPYGTHRYTVWTEYRVLNNTYKSSPYLTGNTLRLHYKAQPVNAVWGNSCCLLWEPYGTQIHCADRMQSFCVKAGGTYSNHWALNLACPPSPEHSGCGHMCTFSYPLPCW
jgi:hypothetical protein